MSNDVLFGIDVTRGINTELTQDMKIKHVEKSVDYSIQSEAVLQENVTASYVLPDRSKNIESRPGISNDFLQKDNERIGKTL